MKFLLTILLGTVSVAVAVAQGPVPKRASSPVSVPKFDVKPPQPRSLYERQGVPMWQDSTGTEYDLLAGSGGTLTSVPTQPTADSSTAPASTAFVKNQRYAKEASVAGRLSAKENVSNKINDLGDSVNPSEEYPSVNAVANFITDEMTFARNRTNHFGQQLASTVSDFTEAAQDAVGSGFSTEFSYNDAGNNIGVNAIAATKITEDAARRFVTDANKTDWTAGFNDRIVSAVVSGTTNKTLTLTQADGGTVTATFTDNNSGGTGDMSKATYDGNNNGVVDNAEAVGGIASSNVATKSGTETLDNKFIRSASEVAINTVGGAGYRLDVNGPGRLGAGSVTVAPAVADSSSAIPTSEWVKLQGYAKEVSVALRLSGKAETTHSHPSGQITDFDEAVEDKIGAKVVAGTGISISYNDTNGNTTITSTAGGGNMSTAIYDPGNNGVVDDTEALGGVAASSYATKTGTETLTNKTLDGASNTFQNIPNTAITGLGTASTFNTGTAGSTVPLLSNANSWTTSQRFVNNSGIKINDVSGSFTTNIVMGSTLTANRNLTITTGDAARILTMTGDASIQGTNTGDQTTVTGNAGTATTLQTARTIGISGKATGTATSFNGSANITIPITAVTLVESDIPSLTVPKISGTKAQFNTAATDGDFLFVNDVTSYTDEAVDDRVAALLQLGTGITWTYNDDFNILTPAVSLGSFSTTNLAEGTALYFTDERAQDAVGGGLSAEFTYNDTGNNIAINAIAASKITEDASRQFATAAQKAGWKTTLQKSLTLPSPTNAENITLFYTPTAITITEVDDVLLGSSSPSVTWNIRYASTRDSGSPTSLWTTDRTTTTVAGTTTTTFNNASIPPGRWVWLTSSAQAGTVSELHVTINYQ